MHKVVFVSSHLQKRRILSLAVVGEIAVEKLFDLVEVDQTLTRMMNLQQLSLVSEVVSQIHVSFLEGTQQEVLKSRSCVTFF